MKDLIIKHYLFEDYVSGEYFLVGADDLLRAKSIAENTFTDPHYICKYTEEEAEMSGLDEY